MEDFTLENYVSSEIMTVQQKEKIEKVIEERKNILIVGGTGTGKTTLTNTLINLISLITPNDKIGVIEDTKELESNSNVLIKKLYPSLKKNSSYIKELKDFIKLRPDRIIVGEIRGGEALDLLKAWNTKHPGGVATIHANSAYEGLTRLEQLISEVSNTNMGELIAEAVNLVVFIKKTNNGRKIKEIVEVVGFNKKLGKYQVNQI